MGGFLKMQNPLSTEDELVLLLVRQSLTTEAQDKVRTLLERGPSWQAIQRQAQAHDVLPLLYWSLQRLDFVGVPIEVRTEMEKTYRQNALWNTLFTRELAQVLRLLGEAGVPVIPLKGVALAESLYGDTTLRVCTDIDILVPRPMVLQALNLLLATGYRAEFTEQFFFDLLLRSHIEYALARDDRQFRYLLELHWGLLWGSPWDQAATEEIWAEAQRGDCFGIPAYTLSPEWELLFLAVHAARHQCQGLKWLVDIHVICSTWRIDWEKVREKAERVAWEDAVRLTLSACHALFDTPIPSNFSLGALPPWLKLFPASASATWRDAFFPARLLRRPSEKLRYFLRVLLVPTLAERRLLRLPSFLGFLYYPLRPLRLACKWNWALVAESLRQEAGKDWTAPH
jgi:hypothetical protein